MGLKPLVTKSLCLSDGNDAPNDQDHCLGNGNDAPNDQDHCLGNGTEAAGDQVHDDLLHRQPPLRVLGGATPVGNDESVKEVRVPADSGRTEHLPTLPARAGRQGIHDHAEYRPLILFISFILLLYGL